MEPVSDNAEAKDGWASVIASTSHSWDRREAGLAGRHEANVHVSCETHDVSKLVARCQIAHFWI